MGRLNCRSVMKAARVKQAKKLAKQDEAQDEPENEAVALPPPPLPTVESPVR